MFRRTPGPSNCTAAARSILATSATSAALNIVGYLRGLSSPSVTEKSYVHSRTRWRVVPVAAPSLPLRLPHGSDVLRQLVRESRAARVNFE